MIGGWGRQLCANSGTGLAAISIRGTVDDRGFGVFLIL
jgi:hypothetical protein